jgi:hypothetical protein
MVIRQSVQNQLGYTRGQSLGGLNFTAQSVGRQIARQFRFHGERDSQKAENQGE